MSRHPADEAGNGTHSRNTPPPPRGWARIVIRSPGAPARIVFPSRVRRVQAVEPETLTRGTPAVRPIRIDLGECHPRAGGAGGGAPAPVAPGGRDGSGARDPAQPPTAAARRPARTKRPHPRAGARSCLLRV